MIRSAYILAMFPVCRHSPTSSRMDVIVMSDPFATGALPVQPLDFKLDKRASRIFVAAFGPILISTWPMACAIGRATTTHACCPKRACRARCRG